jgi:predicted enzyme related to lactoylglutathione lyase
MFTGLSTILSTPDLPRLVAFYTAGLDAEVTYQFPTEGDAGHVALDVAGSSLGIAADPASGAADGPQRHALWVYCTDADAAAERLVAAGGTLVSPPTDMPWGERVADLHDPDRNLLHVAHQLG